MKKFLLALIAPLALGFTACTEDENPGSPIYPDAEPRIAYVLNQGSMFSGIDGTMDILSLEDSAYQSNAFAAINGQSLGNSPQAGIIYGSKLYVAMYGSNLVWVLDRQTLRALGSIPTKEPEGICASEETDRMMANTDPRYVFLCYDTGHFTFAGEDPLAMLKKYVDRVGHVHLKDMRLSVVEEVRKNNWSFLQAVRNGSFTVPGDGDVDFDPVFKVLADAGYQGWLLVEAEQDPAKANPLEYAMKGRKYIREHTGL